MIKFEIASYHDGIFIDSIVFDPIGMISVLGWSMEALSLPTITLENNQQAFEPNVFHRHYRTDVATVLGTNNVFLGFTFEYLFSSDLNSCELHLLLEQQTVWMECVSLKRKKAAYTSLLSESTVKYREDIYGYGPPTEGVPAEIASILDIFGNSQYKCLDFGCGRGNLVNYLQTQGVEASGIEIDRDEIRASLLPACAGNILLYDGSLPLPYENAAFDMVTAIEVIEHIPDYVAVLKGIARIARHRFIMTVPDATAIPRCYHEGVVPWHLLEATHFNFFTQKSLHAVLSPYWKNIQFITIGDVQINTTLFSNSIVAICDK